MKLNSKVLKEKLVDKIKNNPGLIKQRFSPKDRCRVNEIELCNVKLWTLFVKETYKNKTYRSFLIGKSKRSILHDLITCEVITSDDDTRIVSIKFEG